MKVEEAATMVEAEVTAAVAAAAAATTSKVAAVEAAGSLPNMPPRPALCAN